jgi:hypothetical protein
MVMAYDPLAAGSDQEAATEAFRRFNDIEFQSISVQSFAGWLSASERVFVVSQSVHSVAPWSAELSRRSAFSRETPEFAADKPSDAKGAAALQNCKRQWRCASGS